MGKTEEQSSACTVDMGRITNVTTVREGSNPWRNMLLPSRVRRVECSSVELKQTQSLNELHS